MPSRAGGRSGPRRLTGYTSFGLRLRERLHGERGSWRVWAAETWARILAFPFGTTGLENPIT
jgi:hypothetical protein